jgi:hypothetical protein
MSMDIMELLQDIRDRVVKIETVLERHVEDDEQVAKQVQKNTNDILVAKTSVRVLKWTLGVLLVTQI